MSRTPRFTISSRLGALFLLAALPLLSCGTAPLKTYYMLVNADLEESPDSDPPLCALGLGMNPLEVAPPFDISKIIFRPDPLEVRFYTQSQWVSPPEEMFSKLIARRIEAAHLFSVVDSSVNISGPHLSLLVKVYAVEEVDDGKEWQGRLAMNFYLRDEMEDELLWKHRFDVKESADKAEVKSVVEVLNRIYNREIGKAVESMSAFIKSGGCQLSKGSRDYYEEERRDEPDDEEVKTEEPVEEEPAEE